MSLEIKIEGLVYGGLGIGRIDGKVTFVPFSAPNDLLEVEITNQHHRHDSAVIEKIIKPSPYRTEPRCRYFGICGGCQLQHIKYDSQLIWKQHILEEQISRLGGIINPVVLDIIPSPSIWNYRNRIQVHHKEKNTGFFKLETNDIVDIDYCPIADNAANERLKEIRRDWPQGSDRYEIPEKNAKAFQQINPGANEELKKIVTGWVLERQPKNILELYSGSGNLTFELAGLAETVTAIESDQNAVDEACRLAAEKKTKNIRFIKGRSERYLKDAGSSYDIIIADPPREGLGKDVVNRIVKIKPSSIIYVSCNPSTLARDLKLFIKQGYRFVRSQPLDMFPQTYHIESVSLLEASLPHLTC